MKLSRIEAIMLGLMASVVCLILVVAAGIAVYVTRPPTNSSLAPSATQATLPSAAATDAIKPTETQSAATDTPTVVLASATTGSAASSLSVLQFQNALGIKPSGIEAQQALARLTPTPIPPPTQRPAPPTAIPTRSTYALLTRLSGSGNANTQRITIPQGSVQVVTHLGAMITISVCKQPVRGR